MTECFVEVAVPVPVEGTFDYAAPEGVRVEPGMRVLVPYGRRELVGVVLSVKSSSGSRKVRSLRQVLDETPVLPPALLAVLQRAAEDALAPVGIAVAAAIPPGTAPRPGRRVRLLDGGRRALEAGEARGTLGKVLWALGRGPQPESRLRTRFPAAVPALEQLEKIGWISREAVTERPAVRVLTERVYRLAPGLDLDAWRERLQRAPRRRELLQSLGDEPRPLRASPALKALIEAGAVLVEERERVRGEVSAPLLAPDGDFTLTPHQRDAVSEIVGAVQDGRDATFLLHGITGSGKTEVYLRAAARALELERGVIVLVPEISLTHQVVDRFRARFGERVAVLHSGLSRGERFDQWRRIREGAQPIAIGARSAVFAPFERSGLIVIDEEHDGAYKSEEGFRYHARDIAQLRGRAEGCPVVLGSATPDVGTTYRAERGEIERLVLPERVASRPLPRVEIVDLGAEPRRRSLLSRPLRQALAKTLAAGQQAILLLNRRGFASRVFCFACGHAIECRHCDISLVYHVGAGERRPDVAEQGELQCHYCGYREDPSSTCPACGTREGALLGFGTERLQEQVSAMFPHASVGRLDRDTSARKGAQREILAAFHRGETDVLVGTQMVAKGHDIPNVTLVGVIAADLGLHFPDYRAGERTFQLLTQVAGRAGRGEDPGRVVIQTFLPDHYAIALARTHDYTSFYREEVERRRPHGYPPFRSLLQVTFAAAREDVVRGAAEQLARVPGQLLGLQEAESVEVLGPAPAPIVRVRDRFRWQLLLLGPPAQLRFVGREIARRARSKHSGVTLRLVPNPVQML
jgi:primosomal protein N' (replication factor Y)